MLDELVDGPLCLAEEEALADLVTGGLLANGEYDRQTGTHADLGPLGVDNRLDADAIDELLERREPDLLLQGWIAIRIHLVPDRAGTRRLLPRRLSGIGRRFNRRLILPQSTVCRNQRVRRRDCQLAIGADELGRCDIP